MSQTIKFSPILFITLYCVFAASTFGQTAAKDNQTTVISNDFELNIVEDRISETNFARSTAAELTSENLSIKIGAAIGAERIDVLLRGITGNVRFRASFQQLRNRFERLQQALQNAQTSP